MAAKIVNDNKNSDQLDCEDRKRQPGPIDEECPEPLLLPSFREVDSCQFSSWYPTFSNLSCGEPKKSVNQDDNNTPLNTNSGSSINGIKKRKNVTIKSVILRPISTEFVNYLLSDGVKLPECAALLSSCIGGSSGGDDFDDSSDDDSQCSGDSVQKYDFSSLTAEIQDSITKLGGAVFPKMNWSSPKDASWINCGTLKCQTAGDVYLLLKSSEFIIFDLERAWDGLSDDLPNESEQSLTPGNYSQCHSKTRKPTNFKYELILRKWCNLHPSMEFRCFVYNHVIVAISQRHPSKHYPHLTSENNLSELLATFHKTYIQYRYANGFVRRYVFDAYVDSEQRVWIVDFNVWGERTDALLFEWNELNNLGKEAMEITNGVNDKEPSQESERQLNIKVDKKSVGMKIEHEPKHSTPIPEMRVVTKGMKSMRYDPLSSFRGPTDVLDLFTGAYGQESKGDLDGEKGNSIPFEDFMKQCVRPSEL